MKALKNGLQKFLIIDPNLFFFSAQPIAHSQECIFHVLNMSQDSSVSLSVVEKFMFVKSRVEKSGFEKFKVEMSGVEKFMVEKAGVETFLLVLSLNCLKLRCSAIHGISSNVDN